MSLSESVIEDADAALAWLQSIGYAVKHGPEIAPDAFVAERAAPVAKDATTVLGKVQRATVSRKEMVGR